MDQKRMCKLCCIRETFNKNDDFCIFHSEDIEGKKNQFNEAFDKECESQDQGENDFDFYHFIFPDDFDYFEKNIIRKNIRFEYAIFKGEADFEGSTFEGKAVFKGSAFEGGANFSYATFERESYFSRATFEGWDSFRYAKFKRESDFEESIFKGEADFKGSTFEGGANFSGATFEERSDFNLENINYNKLNLRDTFFYDLRGLLDQVEKEIKNNKLDNIYYINKSKTTSNNKILSKLINCFINRFRITKFVNNEINPILGERTAKRYPIIARTISDDNYLIRFKKKHPKLFLFWWFFSDCGRGFFRWASWSIIFAIFFGFIYSNIIVPAWLPDWIQNFLLNIDPKLTFTSPPNVFTPFYYSIVTFTTLGFGDVIPTNFWGEFWVTFEVILGYVMLGGLISILANKIARRS